MFTVLFVIASIAFLILAHEAAHFLTAKFFNMKVEEFGFGFPPRMFSWRPKGGETEYSFNWLPFGGFVRIAGENDRITDGAETFAELSSDEKKRIFAFQPAWKRAIVTGAGVGMNFVLGWVLLSFVLMLGSPSVLMISGIQPNSPAATVGLVSGDVVKEFSRAQDFISFVNAHRGENITLHIVRGGKELEINATPRREVVKNEGALGVFLAEGGQPRMGFFGALREGFTSMFAIAQLTLMGFWQLLTNLFGHARLLEGVVGPIGIVSVAVETGKIGFVYVLQLIAFISVNLAVMNLIPFPALDGGRLLFLGLEKLKGSPLPKRLEAYANGFGFAFLLILIVLISARDVMALIT